MVSWQDYAGRKGGPTIVTPTLTLLAILQLILLVLSVCRLQVRDGTQLNVRVRVRVSFGFRFKSGLDHNTIATTNPCLSGYAYTEIQRHRQKGAAAPVRQLVLQS